MSWQSFLSTLNDRALSAIVLAPALAVGLPIEFEVQDYLQHLYHNPVIAIAGGVANCVAAAALVIGGEGYLINRASRLRVQAGDSR